MTTTDTLELDIEGMHCGSCALLIDDTLAHLPGVVSSRTSHKDARASLTIDPTQVDHAQIHAAIHELGYRTRQVLVNVATLAGRARLAAP
jgi:Cu+-exporting ATPase